jgi:hypothetical protein
LDDVGLPDGKRKHVEYGCPHTIAWQFVDAHRNSIKVVASPLFNTNTIYI